jgi:hypothetical protein
VIVRREARLWLARFPQRRNVEHSFYISTADSMYRVQMGAKDDRSRESRRKAQISHQVA